MSSRDFCYWLQGFFELHAAGSVPDGRLTAEQSDLVRRHLALVFAHEIDPATDGGDPAKKAKLNAIHGPPMWSGDAVARC